MKDFTMIVIAGPSCDELYVQSKLECWYVLRNGSLFT